MKLGKNGMMGIILRDAPIAGKEIEFEVTGFFFRLLFLTYLINFALAIINTLPFFIPPVLGTDGFQLVAWEIRKILPKNHKKHATKITIGIGILIVLLILINFIPHFR